VRVAIAISIWVAILAFMPAHADGTFTKITVGDRVGYIVPEQMSPTQMEWTDEMSPKDRSAYWTPTAEQAWAADAAIRKFIHLSKDDPVLAFPNWVAYFKKEPRAAPNASNEIGLVEKNLTHYIVQFVGLVQNGKKRIYFNYFDPIAIATFKTDPSSQFIDVNDGGYHFWQIEYDLDSKTCSNLQINGPWEHDW
jgi:hypothetical protein